MARIKYIEHGGRVREVEVETGLTVMEGAVDNEVEGVIAECGGGCACATCHCYIDPEWVDRLPPMEEMERLMLECAWEPKKNSRLTCQLEVTDEFDGLVVRVPAEQN